MKKSEWSSVAIDGPRSQATIKSWFASMADDMAVTKAEILCDIATNREKKIKILATNVEGKCFQLVRTLDGKTFSISRKVVSS